MIFGFDGWKLGVNDKVLGKVGKNIFIRIFGIIVNQNIILTKDVPVLLSPKQNYRFKLYGMSTEFGDEIPRKGVTYDLGIVGGSFLRLTKRIEHDAMQNQIGQCALWAFIGKFDRSSFLKYFPDEKLLNKVAQLLDSSGVKTILNKKSGSSLSILLSQQNQNSKGPLNLQLNHHLQSNWE